jgi:anti-anti-sigma factor
MPDQAAAHGAPAQRHPRVLLVDDRPDNLLALQAVLEPLGLHMTTAPSGEEALRRLLSEEFSLIVLDVQMPGLDGFETARLIKLREKTRHIPIIFLTAISGATEHHLEGYASGAIDYVYKPFEPAILRAKVAALVELVGVKQRLEEEVAERTASEQRLAESEDRYRSLIEHAPEAIVVLDLETRRFVEANPQAERLFGMARAQLCEIGPDDLRAPAQAGDAAGDWVERARSGKGEPFEWNICTPTGTRVLCEVRLLELPSSGRRLARGSLIDITERRRIEDAAAAVAERERALRQTQQIAQTLQRSLLPERLPEIPGMEMAVRYLPGSAGLEVGGDWYDVVPMPSGAVCLAIGDVVGRGLSAAATMGQLRTALRAYALDDESPERVIGRLGGLATVLPEAEMTTLIYAVYQPEAGMLSYMCAGHPPPLLLHPGGTASFLCEGRVTPLGVPTLGTPEGIVVLEPGSVLILYTDGLVERPGSTLDEGLQALADVVEGVSGADPEAMCEAITAAMIGDAASRDDVALLVISCVHALTREFRLSVSADPQRLGPLRWALSRWLAHVGATADERRDIVLAVSEAATNSIVHAYGFDDGTVEVLAESDGQGVTVTVRDTGYWRSWETSGGGRGLLLMQALVEDCEVVAGPQGTEVRLSRRLGVPMQPSSPKGVRISPEMLSRGDANGDATDEDLIAVAHLAEDIDVSNADRIGATLAGLVRNEQWGLVVDVSRLSFIDSSGIRLLFDLKRRLERRRQALWAVVPGGSPVYRVLELTQVGGIVPLAATVDDAVAAIRQEMSRTQRSGTWLVKGAEPVAGSHEIAGAPVAR